MVLEIKHLVKSFNNKAVLKDISLEVEQGEAVAVIGPSGSGKSTLLRQLKTALAPNGVRRGAVLFDGRLLSDVSPREQAERIGFERAVIPKHSLNHLNPADYPGMKLIGAAYISDAINALKTDRL